MPPYLRTALLLTCFVAIVWLWDFIELMAAALQPCKSTVGCWSEGLSYLQTQAVSTAVYMAWFTVSRLLLFNVPRAAAVASRTGNEGRSFCQTYCASLLLRDGPHYVFLAGSVWLFLKLLAADPESAIIDMSQPDVAAIEAFKTYSIVTCALSVLCFMLASSHNSWIDVQHQPPRVRGRQASRGAPAGTIEKLAVQRYDPALFGDEEGKTYPADCAICLCSWEPADEIRVTPCGHAFHKDCIAQWFNTARTCALCRLDLADAAPSGPSVGSEQV